MVSVGIIGLGAYVPPNEMSNEDWMEYVDTVSYTHLTLPTKA